MLTIFLRLQYIDEQKLVGKNPDVGLNEPNVYVFEALGESESWLSGLNQKSHLMTKVKWIKNPVYS